MEKYITEPPRNNIGQIQNFRRNTGDLRIYVNYLNIIKNYLNTILL